MPSEIKRSGAQTLPWAALTSQAGGVESVWSFDICSWVYTVTQISLTAEGGSSLQCIASGVTQGKQNFEMFH